MVEKEFKSFSLVLCLWKRKREDRGKRERRRGKMGKKSGKRT